MTIQQVGYFNTTLKQSIVKGGISDQNSIFYGKTGINKKYINESNVYDFIKSKEFGTFLGETLNDHRLLYKTFGELENQFRELNDKKEDFRSIMEKYFYTNVEKFIIDEEERRFIILLNEVLIDKIISPIPIKISQMKNTTSEIISKKEQ